MYLNETKSALIVDANTPINAYDSVTNEIVNVEFDEDKTYPIHTSQSSLAVKQMYDDYKSTVYKMSELSYSKVPTNRYTLFTGSTYIADRQDSSAKTVSFNNAALSYKPRATSRGSTKYADGLAFKFSPNRNNTDFSKYTFRTYGRLENAGNTNAKVNLYKISSDNTKTLLESVTPIYSSYWGGPSWNIVTNLGDFNSQTDMLFLEINGISVENGATRYLNVTNQLYNYPSPIEVTMLVFDDEDPMLETFIVNDEQTVLGKLFVDEQTGENLDFESYL